jgi:hypothetical protein
MNVKDSVSVFARTKEPFCHQSQLAFFCDIDNTIRSNGHETKTQGAVSPFF